MPRVPSRLLRLSLSLSISCVALTAWADPPRVPVLAVGTGDASPTDAQLASAVSAVGADARSGQALSDELLTRFGVFAPDDALTQARAEVDQARAAYVSDGRDRALQRMNTAVQHFEAPSGAQSLRLLDDDHRAYTGALARIAQWQFDRHNAAEAERALRRLLTFDESWIPGDAEPPPVHTLAAQVRASMGLAPVTARGTISIDVPSPQCAVRVDGQTQPLQGTHAAASVVPGEHRVTVRCALPSRVRVVRVTNGATTSLAVDPRLDAALRTDAMPGLRYASSTDMASSQDSDLAALGAALGAARVVAVGARDATVIDVASRHRLAQHPLDASLSARLATTLSGRDDGPATPHIDPRPEPRYERTTGAGPWILVGAGAAALGVGAFFFVQRSSALDDLGAVCPSDEGGYACPDTLTDGQIGQANDARDRANTATMEGTVTLAAGAGLVVGGLLWYALAPRREVMPLTRLTPSGRTFGLQVTF